MMRKVIFTEFRELKQGDGKGPKYDAGKAYWLSPDQAERFTSEGSAEMAPGAMTAENEPAEYLPRAQDVKLMKVGRKWYDVVGVDGYKYNDEPVSAHDAEKLRQRVLSGQVRIAIPELDAIVEPDPAAIVQPEAPPAEMDLEASPLDGEGYPT